MVRRRLLEVLLGSSAAAERLEEVRRRRRRLREVGRRGKRVVLLVGIDRRVERLCGGRLILLRLVLGGRRQGRRRMDRLRDGRRTDLVELLLEVLVVLLMLRVGRDRLRLRVMTDVRRGGGRRLRWHGRGRRR